MKYFTPLILLLFPFVSDAVLVACGDNPLTCNWCSFVQTINNVIQFIITILILCAVLIMMYAGFRMTTSGGDVGAAQEAKKLFTNVIIGFILILASWTLVDTLLKAVMQDQAAIGKIWQPVDCGFMAGSVGLSNDRYDNGELISEAGIAGGATTNSSGTVTPTGNLVTYAGAQFDEGIVSNVQYISDTFGLRVSGGYRTPERNLAVNGSPTSHHLSGRAADFVGSASQMQAGADWARANGAREVLIHNAGSGTHLHVAW